LEKLTTVSVLERTDVVQLDDVAALVATLNRAFTGDLVALSVSIFDTRMQGGSYGEPVDLVRVGRETSATGVLLVTSTVDDDGVVERS
jgi:hypothetical protein